jgi:hypothetical protein
VVVGVRPTGGVTSGNRQPPEPDVVHDHIRLRQHQTVAAACIGFGIGALHIVHAGPTEVGETVSGSSCSIQLSPGGGSTEMISCQRPNRGGLGGPGLTVAAPGRDAREDRRDAS